jgi:hypothetical protein
MAIEITPLIRDLFLDAMSVVTSADKAYKYFRELGYEWTRSEVREAWKIVGEKDRWATVIKTYGTDRPIPRAWVVQQEAKSDFGYMHLVKLTYSDPTTGNIEEKFISYTSDRVMAYDDVYKQIEDYLEEYRVADKWGIIDVSPGGVVKAVVK